MTLSHNFSFGDMKVNLTATGKTSTGKPRADTPFRIAILGDFSGRENRGVCEPLKGASRRPMRIDCDNFEEIFTKLSPQLHLPIGDDPQASIVINFSDLDDFHPDQLYDKVDVFQALRHTRNQLMDPSTFDQAAAQVRAWAAQAPPQPDTQSSLQAPPPSHPSPQTGSEAQDEMFTRLLGQPKTETHTTTQSQAAATVESMIKQIVAPHVTPSADPQQAQLIAAVDAAITKQMRAVLHHCDFQCLEAAWRSLDFLVRNIETDEQLQLYVLDLSQQELVGDLNTSDQLESTGLHGLIVEQTVHTPGAAPWAVICGDYTFAATAHDAQLLGRLAKITAAARAPFIGTVHPHLLGCRSVAQTPDSAEWDRPLEPDAQAAWTAVRELPEAAHIGLAAPRFLMRLPYGRDSDEIDRFEFEELDPEHFDPVADHLKFLWANPAFVCTLLLAWSFGIDGWDLVPGAAATFDGLPAHMFKRDGQTEMTPCAEAWLSDRAADAILAKGFMPLQSIKGRDAVRLTRFQSLSTPPGNLAGRWG